MKKNLLYSISFIGLLGFFIWFNHWPNEAEKKTHTRAKIILREVGNQLLLSQKDSTSLILPIIEIANFKYQISFENHVAFEPTTLVTIIKETLKNTDFAKNYQVEVLECITAEVAYSFEIHKEIEKTIIPCAGRFLPKKCYLIEINFMSEKSSTFNYSMLFYIFIPLFFVIFYRKYFTTKKTKTAKNELETSPIALGIFNFYPAQSKLVQKKLEIKLSKKECELLAIFVANPNQIIKREALTKKVWEDHGVFVGRSLDTYISKLRKKLKQDAAIQFINIHGVGYKMEIKR